MKRMLILQETIIMPKPNDFNQTKSLKESNPITIVLITIKSYNQTTVLDARIMTKAGIIIGTPALKKPHNC